MKKTFTLFLGLLAFGWLAAQKLQVPNPGMAHLPMKTTVRVPQTGLEDYLANPHHVGIPASNSGLRTADEIGFTFYDLQANASDNNRIINLGNNDLRAIWTFNKVPNDGAYDDRGMAYTRTVAGAFPTAIGQQPKERVESVRTGFGSFGVTDNSTEIIVAHTATGTGTYALHYAKRPAGGGAWSEGNLPTATPNGLLWPRLAASGSRVHVIALTTPSGTFGGVDIDGINGDIRYFRSSDNGATWDKQDVKLPGLDASVLRAHNAEQYVIDADGDNVAIGIFPTLNDICYWKSTDGGETFVKHTVYDSPLTNFVIGDGYTVADIDTAFSSKPADDLGVIDSTALFSSDEHGAIRIDALGVVHLCYGAGFLNAYEAVTTYSYYPSSGGIVYWNENMAEDTEPLDGFPTGIYAGQVIDYDGNGGIGLTLGATGQYNSYGGSFMASMPTMGLGEQGTIYIAYGAADERYINSDLDKGYRHTHIVKLVDDGTQLFLDGPYDVNNVNNMEDVEISITETVFPFLARNCEDKIHLIYTQDNIPGSFVTDNAAGTAPTADDLTFIKYLGLDPDLVVASKEARPAPVSMNLFPNPATETLNVDLVFSGKADRASLSVFNMNGQLVFQQAELDLTASRVSVPVAQLKNGVYSLTVRTDAGLASRKFTVVR